MSFVYNLDKFFSIILIIKILFFYFYFFFFFFHFKKILGVSL